MYKLIALYQKPDDVNAFLEYYENTHMKIVDAIPGLKECVVNRVTGSPMGGEPAYFMITEMVFETKEGFKMGMNSPENIAAGKDLRNFAKGLVTLVTSKC